MLEIWNAKLKHSQSEITIKSCDFVELIRLVDAMSIVLKLDKLTSSPDKLINALVNDLGYENIDEFLNKHHGT